MPWLVHCELRQSCISVIVNKFGDASKKTQCHAINCLVKVVRQSMRELDEESPKLILNEILVFLARPTTKPSHRVYCLGFLNKFASLDNQEVLKQLLSIYFGLFNKLLHQNPE
jgi:hypothetical protein